jgi:hypothetical protein
MNFKEFLLGSKDFKPGQLVYVNSGFVGLEGLPGNHGHPTGFDSGDELIFLRTSDRWTIFTWYGVEYHAYTKEFNEACSTKKISGNERFMGGLLDEDAHEVIGEKRRVDIPFTGVRRTYNQFSGEESVIKHRFIRDDAVTVASITNTRVEFAWFGNYYWVDKETFYKSTIDEKTHGRRFLDTLADDLSESADESADLQPTYDEFDKAADIAIDWYQKECDEWNRENESKFVSKVGVEWDSNHYWNPVTKEFLIHVRDQARMSCDDGVMVRIDRNGNPHLADVNDYNKPVHPLADMHDDPEVAGQMAAKFGKYVKINMDEI